MANKYKSWRNVPLYEQMQLRQYMDEFGRETGFQFKISDKQLLQMANGNVVSQVDFGVWAMAHLGSSNPGLKNMPWAKYGLMKDSYQQLATTYSTEYKKITGKDIPPDQLTKAFLTSNLAGGGLLSGSQYGQQLMNDAAVQKQFGWVKYGLDFTAWTQQKLSMRETFGRDINDAEASNLLQYTKATTGSNMSAVSHAAQKAGAPASQGISGSVAR